MLTVTMRNVVLSIAFAAAPLGSAKAQDGMDALSEEAAAAYDAGLAAMREREFETAIERFDDVLDEDKAHAEANYFAGLAYAYTDEDKKAERYLKRAVKARATFLEAREWLARIQVRRGDADKAREQLAALVELKDGCAPEVCDDAYVARAEKAAENVKKALASQE